MFETPIYKTFYGKHIDLSKLVSIDNVYFTNRMSAGGYFVGFDMYFQLLDNPIYFRRHLNEFEYRYIKNEKCFLGDEPYRSEICMVDGSWKSYSGEDSENILAVANLQKQVDEIIKAWTDYSTYIQNH